MVAQYQNKRGIGSFLFTFAQRSITHKLEAYNKLTCGASDHEMKGFSNFDSLFPIPLFAQPCTSNIKCRHRSILG